jgi:dienelactone hydrolase
MKNKYLLTIVPLIFLFITASSQELISYEEQLYLDKATIQASLGISANYDVRVFKIIYSTLDVFMEKDTVSGILAVPLDPYVKFPFLIYDHGTVADRYSVPSEGSTEQLIAVGIAAQGYLCAAPDYVGLGVSEGLHPYLHPDTEARAGIDLVKAVKNLEETESIFYNEQLFVTGYSQGGHAAMATIKYLQQSGEMQVTAAAPMSGPYSVSEVMKTFTLGDEEYFFVAYLISVSLTTIHAYPDLMTGVEIEDIIREEYHDLVQRFIDEEINLFEMNDQIIMTLAEDGGQVLARRILKDGVYDALVSEQEYPLNQALRKLDVNDWIPQMPVKMFYCEADDQVSYINATYTDSLMNAQGATDVSSESVIAFADHSTCAYPAILKMMGYFSDFQEIIPVSTRDDINNDVSLNIWPNPASDQLNIHLGGNNLNECHIGVFDINGSLMFEASGSVTNRALDISALRPGMYYVRVIDRKGISTSRRFIISG